MKAFPLNSFSRILEQGFKRYYKSLLKTAGFYGTSNGTRTHDFALRGQRLNLLTMEAKKVAGELGFEPRQYESES